MNSIFAKVSASLETRRLKVQKELETMSVEIEKVDAEIALATGAKKTMLMANRSNLQKKFDVGTKKFTAISTSQYAIDFLDRLFGSFKSKWIPIICVILLVLGTFESLTGFIVGSVVNVAILFALLCVVMHVQKKKYEENPEMKAQDKDMVVAKILLLAITVLKTVLSFFGPTVMMVVVIIGAIGIALYIERKDLKVLFERLKENNLENKDNDNSDSDE